MTKREAFIKIVEEIFSRPDIYTENYPDTYHLANEYWNEFNLAHLDNIQLRQENEQLKQFKDTTFVLINEMIETANLYRTPIKSLHYGDDLGYWNGVYQKLKELKEILFEKGDVE